MLTVVTPASDPALIAIADLRAACGYDPADSSHDADLQRMSERLTQDVCLACNIAIAAGYPPTLRREVLRQSFRFPRFASIVLARRHDVEIVSIDIDGADLGEDEREVDSESGIVRRLCDGRRSAWRGKMVTVTYRAGFVAIPADLSGTVADLARFRISEAARDPLMRSVTTDIDGLESIRRDYWIGALPGQEMAGGALPSHLLSQLKRFRNAAVA